MLFFFRTLRTLFIKDRIMKKIATILIVLAVAAASFSGCKKTTEITCSLFTAATTPPVDMVVVYTATATGDGTISTLSYVTPTGTVTVQNPSLPWTISVNVLTTTNVQITASGTTKNGSLTISYEGNVAGSRIYGSDFCSQE
jgi:hypothetical protein